MELQEPHHGLAETRVGGFCLLFLQALRVGSIGRFSVVRTVSRSCHTPVDRLFRWIGSFRSCFLFACVHCLWSRKSSWALVVMLQRFFLVVSVSVK